MIERTVTVNNRAGIHARPAALIVQTAGKFQSKIFLKKETEEINAKSIMGIITLGAAYGTELQLCVEGDDEEEAAESIAKLFDDRFEEE